MVTNLGGTGRGKSALVDSLAASGDAESGRQTHGDFSALLDFLTLQLVGTVPARIWGIVRISVSS
jgi:hypothetical protein